MLSFACQNQPERDVVITGMGMVTPLSLSHAGTWQKLTTGTLGCRQLERGEIDYFEQLEDIAGLQIAGAPVPHAEVQQSCATLLRAALPAERLAELPVRIWLQEAVVAMTLHAALEASAQANLRFPVQNPERCGCFIGASKGGLRSAEWLLAKASADRRATPEMPLSFGHNFDSGAETDDRGDVWWHAFQTDAACRAVSTVAGATGGTSTPVAACATGLVSLLQAAAAIHSGQLDVCFAGSGDAAVRASVLSSFHRLRVTSRNASSATAGRPFDKHRDGFVIGEGAAVFILESRQHAQARGAATDLRLSGGGWLSDPSGMTQVDTSGRIVAELLRRTMSVLNGSDRAVPIDYMNLHGTGTPANDLAEARGIRQALQDPLPRCSGWKGALGHLLGGAASVEAALTVQALRDGYFPGTMNLSEPDPECPVPLLMANWSRPEARRAAKLSLGFGGHVACAVFDHSPDCLGPVS